VVNDRISCIAGCEQHLEIRPSFHRLLGQLPAVHAARDHHVGKQQIDVLLTVENLESRCRGGRTENAIAEIGQNLECISAQGLVVFDNKDRLTARRARDFPLRIALVLMLVGTEISRQIDFYSRAFAQFAIDLHIAGRLANESIHLAKTKPSALAGLFGCEEWFAGTLNGGLVHSDAVIGHRDHDVLARGHWFGQ